MHPMHPELVALLTLTQGRPRFEDLSPEAARQAYAAGRDAVALPTEDVASVRDVATPSGIRIRLYRAAGTEAAAQLPCLLYLHGGGWVVGDLDSHDSLCRVLANASATCVASVDYRLAPEHPYPAAVDDAAEALRWVANQGPSLGIDPARLAVGGDSAGGNLAAVLALMARDGAAPPLSVQLLFYPVTDLAAEAPSYATTRQDLPLNAASMRWFIDLYCPPAARTDWQASPARAPALSGLPPALIITAGHDPLADEGHAYAAALEAAAVPVTTLHVSDHAHGFLNQGALFTTTHPILTYAGTVLRAHLT